MRSPRRQLRSQAGVSLTEVIVATSIFASTVLGLMNAFLNTTKAAMFTENSSAAITLAQDKLEQLRSLPSTNSQLAAGTWPDSLNPLAANATTGGIFTRSWTVTNNTPVTGMKRVEMRVSWRDRMGSPSVTLVALVMP
jgi:Tfp pilus assembly protein PilV